MRSLIPALLLGASAALAQKPNFSGTWVRNDSVPGRTVTTAGDAAFRRGDMGAGWGSPLTVTQADDKLRVVFDFFIAYDLQPKVRYTYALDGSESRQDVNVGHATISVRSRVAWEGAKLVITTEFPAPPDARGAAQHVNQRQTLSLDESGRLVIESARAAYPGTGAVNTVVTTWTKR